MTVCGFCHGRPVGNAERWWKPDAPRYAPCPRCGRLEPEPEFLEPIVRRDPGDEDDAA